MLTLKRWDRFTKIVPIFIAIIGNSYSVAFVFLSKVLQVLPVAVIYPFWLGLRTASVTTGA